MSKIGRNDKCPCNSNKKYKQCCLIKEKKLGRDEQDKYIDGQKISTEYIGLVMEYLKDEYQDHKIIDITNHLNNDNYKTYQIKNYTNKTIMIAEKTVINHEVFAGRGQADNDVIIMYRGSYRTFHHNNLAGAVESIDKMIKIRLSGKEDNI